MKADNKVVCIRTVTTRTSGHVGAVKGKIYTVEGVLTCSCGNRGLNVGIEIPAHVDIFYATCRCGKKYITTRIWWHPERAFRPIDWEDCRDELIEKALETKTEIEIVKEPQL